MPLHPFPKYTDTIPLLQTRAQDCPKVVSEPIKCPFEIGFGTPQSIGTHSALEKEYKQ